LTHDISPAGREEQFESRKSKKLRPDKIAALTFHLFLKEGGPDGKEHELWNRAEKMLREEIEQQKSAISQ